jgi:hypothetical protein
MRLPRGTDAIIDLAKLREYVLNNTKHACLLLPCRSIKRMPNSLGKTWRMLLQTEMPYLGNRPVRTEIHHRFRLYARHVSSNRAQRMDRPGR